LAVFGNGAKYCCLDGADGVDEGGRHNENQTTGQCGPERCPWNAMERRCLRILISSARARVALGGAEDLHAKKRMYIVGHNGRRLGIC
jgi:hypothetical protein